jgi:hypothetical protein
VAKDWLRAAGCCQLNWSLLLLMVVVLLCFCLLLFCSIPWKWMLQDQARL